MKKIRLLLFAIGVFALIGVPKVDALRVFSYDKSSGLYGCFSSGGSNDLVTRYDDIQSWNVCDSNDNFTVPSGIGQKTACEEFGGSWYPYGGNVNYGDCKIINKTVCETKGGTFYPAIVTNNGPINIDTDTTINYMLIAYDNLISINAKVSFVDYGNILGTIGINGKIVISDSGKIEYPTSSDKIYGNSSDYALSLGTGSTITYKSLMANGAVLPAAPNDTDGIPDFLSRTSSIGGYLELDGDFKVNQPLIVPSNPSGTGAGSQLVLKDNSSLDLLSNLTIENSAKVTTGLNSTLLNSANLTVDGNLDVYGKFNNGYKLDDAGNPTISSTGTTIIGTTGKITLYGNTIVTNNSTTDIPVTLVSGNPGDTPIESVIPGNSPRTITINSEITHGTVTSSKSSATNGEEITLTIIPENGYRIKSISVLDRFDDQPVIVTNSKFTMPSYNVFVNVIFEEIIDNPRTGDSILYSLLLGSISLIGLLGTGLYTRKNKFK